MQPPPLERVRADSESAAEATRMGKQAVKSEGNCGWILKDIYNEMAVKCFK